MENSQPLGKRGRCFEVGERARTAAQQRRREIQQQLVGEARGKQRTGEAGTALDQKLVDLPRRESGQRRLQVDAARASSPRP